ncbi:MAG: hypothetical protein KJ052_00760 [Candidatus Hydrogenedentes bacterium]|nr:hypothetical protein [Candidatus Hydrogenedentota bacterium]
MSKIISRGRVLCKFTATPLLAITLAVSLCNCNTFGFREKSTPTSKPSETIDQAASTADHEATVLDLVRRHVAAVGRSGEGESGEIIRKRPYYYKEYTVYADTSNPEVDIRETPSRTAPFIANVTLPAQRYATQLRRNRAEAAADSDYQRHTGNETLTFEYKNGRWVRVGSLFIAQRIEENINGEWVLFEEEIEDTLAAPEEGRGWFGRIWSGVTGR